MTANPTLMNSVVSPSTQDEIQKSQRMRLIDVLVLAPFLFYLSVKDTKLSKTEKFLLAAAASGIMFYNGNRLYIYNELKKLHPATDVNATVVQSQVVN